MIATISHDQEMRARERFAFGENWTRFLERLDKARIAEAVGSLQEMLGVARFDGLTFIDVGCGSGLFSLAARRLGARVRSFDYDPQSVACARELKRRYLPDDVLWQIESGSVLDRNYLSALGRFDIVYSWGVLHHTGSMWQALAVTADLVADDGQLLIALYNDQGWRSRAWWQVKRNYQRLPVALRRVMIGLCLIAIWGPASLRDLARLQPGTTWRNYGGHRGMSPLHDLIDWVGGFPFEVATRDAVVSNLGKLGFVPVLLISAGKSLGCNQFVFERAPRDAVA